MWPSLAGRKTPSGSPRQDSAVTPPRGAANQGSSDKASKAESSRGRYRSTNHTPEAIKGVNLNEIVGPATGFTVDRSSASRILHRHKGRAQFSRDCAAPIRGGRAKAVSQ
ncbi:unnamed protein product [Protopolystoma xenopodis]|uniref:Uncharacterized protein n=1 Tax=Protopolystoma xenopodis TaxID=117903 RepID=A0A3S5AA63_9PLAT|nr:unnamed protein product [Protopolystoma xenopodis]